MVRKVLEERLKRDGLPLPRVICRLRQWLAVRVVFPHVNEVANRAIRERDGVVVEHISFDNEVLVFSDDAGDFGHTFGRVGEMRVSDEALQELDGAGAFCWCQGHGIGYLQKQSGEWGASEPKASTTTATGHNALFGVKVG